MTADLERAWWAAIILCRRSCMRSPWARLTLPQSFIALAHVASHSLDQIERASDVCLDRVARGLEILIQEAIAKTAPRIWPKAQISR
jgi:hypothetical protein